MDTAAFAETIARPIVRYLTAKLDAFSERLDGFQQRVSELKLEKGEPGVKGDPGIDGKEGSPGRDGKDGRDGIDGISGSNGENGRDGVAGAPGRDGIDGKNGTEGVNGIPGLNGRDGKDGIDGKNGIDGKDGVDGKDGPPGLNGKDGLDGKVGVDGKDGIHGKDGQDGIDGKDGKDGRDGREGKDGRDGAPGHDALELAIMLAIDPEKEYPHGTWARARGGLVRRYGTEWIPMVNGYTNLHAELSGRELSLIWQDTSGAESIQKFVIPMMIYCGIFKAQTSYYLGDVVTYGGSSWHCQVETTKSAPAESNSDWRLIVREGRRGKDGKDGSIGPQGPEGKPGRDLTQMGFNGAKY